MCVYFYFSRVPLGWLRSFVMLVVLFVADLLLCGMFRHSPPHHLTTRIHFFPYTLPCFACRGDSDVIAGVGVLFTCGSLHSPTCTHDSARIHHSLFPTPATSPRARLCCVMAVCRDRVAGRVGRLCCSFCVWVQCHCAGVGKNPLHNRGRFGG
jgi:hypothetical protein